jgi:hypothetical protein
VKPVNIPPRFSGVYLDPPNKTNRKPSSTGHASFHYEGKDYYTTEQDTLELQQARTRDNRQAPAHPNRPNRILYHPATGLFVNPAAGAVFSPFTGTVWVSGASWVAPNQSTAAIRPLLRELAKKAPLPTLAYIAAHRIPVEQRNALPDAENSVFESARKHP